MKGFLPGTKDHSIEGLFTKLNEDPLVLIPFSDGVKLWFEISSPRPEGFRNKFSFGEIGHWI